MFFLVPLQVEEAAVDRLPVVSIGIAALCAVVFAATWLAPAGVSEQRIDEDTAEVLGYFREHPYLNLPPAFSARYLGAKGRAGVQSLHEAAAKQAAAGDADIAEEQAYLDSLSTHVIAESDSVPMRRWALVPGRGLFQPGWLTYMFLHFGWMHILGNLLFFYLTGPLLEDLWGRRFFAAFYLLGGLLAGAAQAALDRTSFIAIAGASGAIAACMGAFSHRFAGRRVRMGYLIFFFFRFLRGTFLVPAWLWGLCWFGGQLLSLRTDGNGAGVAFGAHIAGFAFGFLLAMLVTSSGFEERTLRPLVESVTVFRERPPPESVEDRLQAALDAGDLTAAANAYRSQLVSKPNDRAATIGLARLEISSGDAARGVARVEKLIRELLDGGEPAPAWDALVAVAPGDLSSFSPRVAKQLLSASASAPAGAAAMLAKLEPIAARAASQPASLAARPASAASRPGSVAGAPQALRVIPCGLQALDAEAITVEAETGQRRTIPLAQLAGIGSALLPLPEGHAGQLVVTDFVVRFADASGPATVVRIPRPKLGLAALYPGVAPRDAHRRLLAQLLALPHLAALPDRASLSEGRLPGFASSAELDAAWYAAAAPRPA